MTVHPSTASSAGGASGGSLSLPAFSGGFEGAMLVVSAYLEPDTNSWATIGAGYTLVKSEVVTGKFRQDTFVKKATFQEPTTTWVPTSTGFRTLLGASFFNTNGTNPSMTDVVGAATTSTTDVGFASQFAPSVTTTIANDLLLFIYNNFNGTALSSTTGACTNSSVVFGGAAMYYGNVVSAGASGTTTAGSAMTAATFTASHLALAATFNTGLNLIGSPSSNAVASTSTVLSLADGVAGDLAMVIVSTRGGSGTTITVDKSFISTATPRQDNSTSVSTLVFYKIIDGTEGGSCTLGNAGGAKLFYSVMIWRHADQTTPIHLVAHSNIASAINQAVPGLTTTIPGCKVIYSAGKAINTALAAPGTLTDLGGFFTNTAGATSNITGDIGYLDQDVAGAAATQTFTGTTAAVGVAYAIALAPESIVASDIPAPLRGLIYSTLVRM